MCEMIHDNIKKTTMRVKNKSTSGQDNIPSYIVKYFMYDSLSFNI